MLGRATCKILHSSIFAHVWCWTGLLWDHTTVYHHPKPQPDARTFGEPVSGRESVWPAVKLTWKLRATEISPLTVVLVML